MDLLLPPEEEAEEEQHRRLSHAEFRVAAQVLEETTVMRSCSCTGGSFADTCTLLSVAEIESYY